MRLFDSHCHLLGERFSEDLDAVLDRMREAGLALALTVGDGSGEEAPGDIALSQKTDFLYAAVGVHPQDADAWGEESGARLEKWLALPKVVALGEIGLDYHWPEPARDRQRAVLEAQLDLSYRLKKPAILHIRDAHGDWAELLRARDRAGRFAGGVMHCFSGSRESAREYLNSGLYISFSGSVSFKNADKLQEAARYVPRDRLLVETDCPYMAPVPLRGKRNEPAFVAHTLLCLAQLRGEDAESLAEATLENGLRLFGIREPNV